MHYAPVLSDFLVNGTVRDSARSRVQRRYVAKASAWRNWWSMAVVEEARGRTPQARSIGSRGRLPQV